MSQPANLQSTKTRYTALPAKPTKARKIPEGSDPWRRLAAALVLNALEEYIFPTKKTEQHLVNAARQYLTSPEGMGLCIAFGIPANKVVRLRKGELKRYWVQLSKLVN